jgi:aminoglycoside 3-N-acetyltransferase
VRFDELDKGTEDFNQIGWDFVQSGQVKTGKVACAKAQLMPQRALVDFGAQWISRHRK